MVRKQKPQDKTEDPDWVEMREFEAIKLLYGSSIIKAIVSKGPSPSDNLLLFQLESGSIQISSDSPIRVKTSFNQRSGDGWVLPILTLVILPILLLAFKEAYDLIGALINAF
jgi:hypothetical protein